LSCGLGLLRRTVSWIGKVASPPLLVATFVQ
jgi:hypothetical protein